MSERGRIILATAVPPDPSSARKPFSADALSRPADGKRIITLRPGEMSLHHVRLVHGSPPNPSNDRRIGFAIRYPPTDVAQLAGEDGATVVRGEDCHHHFMAEPQPSRDLEFVALHRTITECRARILYRGTDVASYNEPKALTQRG